MSLSRYFSRRQPRMRSLCVTLHNRIYVREVPGEAPVVLKVACDGAAAVREVIFTKLLARHTHPYLIRASVGAIETGEVAIVTSMFACSLDRLLAAGSGFSNLSNSPTMTLARAADRFTVQIGSAVAFLNALGIIHRDIKPGNIFCTTDSLETTDFVLADLGSAVLLRSVETPLYSETVTTRRYAAPEVGVTQPKYSPASDAWAFGMILAELLGSSDGPLCRALLAPDASQRMTCSGFGGALALSFSNSALSFGGPAMSLGSLTDYNVPEINDIMAACDRSAPEFGVIRDYVYHMWHARVGESNQSSIVHSRDRRMALAMFKVASMFFTSCDFTGFDDLTEERFGLRVDDQLFNDILQTCPGPVRAKKE